MGDHEPELSNEELEIVEEDALEPKDQLKKLRTKLKKCEAEKAEHLDGWQRAKADLVNTKRDFADREAKARARGAEDIVERIAPSLDSFHMAMQGKGWESMPKEWKVGIQGIYQQILSVLTEEGLEVLDPTGSEFNPELHESMSVISVEDASQDHVVQQTIQKGLLMNGNLIRPAKVVVGEYTANP